MFQVVGNITGTYGMSKLVVICQKTEQKKEPAGDIMKGKPNFLP